MLALTLPTFPVLFLSLPFAPFLLTSISANNMPLFRTSFISSWLAYEIFSSNIGLFTLELPSLRECLIHSPFIGYDLLYECNQLMWLFYLPCQSSIILCCCGLLFIQFHSFHLMISLELPIIFIPFHFLFHSISFSWFHLALSFFYFLSTLQQNKNISFEHKKLILD